MKGKRAAAPVPGPQRWGYRTYSIQERLLPFGRRFEVRSPSNELVLFCRAKRGAPQIVFYADEEERAELFRLDARPVRQFQRSYDVVDALTGKKFGELRKRVYEPSHKVEWFILDAEGNQAGLLTETAPPPSLIRRLLPMDRFLPKSWALHWGQAIAGTLQPRIGLMGERLELDLKFDAKDEIDRRLALAAAIALQTDQGKPEKPAQPLEPA